MRVVFERGVVIVEYRVTPKVPFDVIGIFDAGNVDPHKFRPTAGGDECALHIVTDLHVPRLCADRLWRVFHAYRFRQFPHNRAVVAVDLGGVSL